MEDTTSNPTNGQDAAGPSPLAIDAADLLISSQAAWDAAPPPKFVDSCDSLRRYGVYQDSGMTTSHPVPCSSWDHQPCAEKHAREELETFVGLLADAEVVFYATVPDAEFKSGRLSGRRRDRAKKEGRVWYRWAFRADGMVWVIASHPLGGNEEPRVFRQTDNPLKIVAVALRQPGVRRVDGSSVKKAQAEFVESLRAAAEDAEEDASAEADADDPKRDEVEAEEDSGPKVKWFPASSYARWQRKNELAAEVAKERFGVDVNPAYPVVAGSGFTGDQWIECLEEAESRM